MSFLPFVHSYLLYFLPLAAIPIVLHLLTLHRLRTVELSTFRFLFDSYVQQRRKMKFLEAIIAALRTLFLLLLIAAVARPAVRHWDKLFGSGSGQEVVILMDTSVSMNTTTDGKSALDRAKSAALAIVEKLGPDDRLTLVRVGSRPEEVFSRYAADSVSIRDKIESLRASSSRANLLATLTQTFGPQSPERSHPTIYLFSDCQASGWREIRNQPTEKLLPEKSRFVVVNVGSSAAISNMALVGDAPRRHRTIVGLPVLLRPRVVNHSKTETVDVAVSVLIDGKEISRPTLTLKPGESATREIVYTPTEPRVLRGRFEVEETGSRSDRFPDDDSFLFTLTVSPQIKVVLINGAPNADPYENETLYLKTALSVGADDEPSPGELSKLSGSKSYVKSLALQEVLEPALNQETLKDASVVILANCGTLNPQQFQWLRDFVSEGGGLLIFPGDKVVPDPYNKQFFPVVNVPDRRLVQADLAPPVGEVNDPDKFERLSADSIDFAHPVLSVFDNPQVPYLTTAHFYRLFPLTLPAEKGTSWTLAKFGSGAAAMVEGRFGEGIVLLSAFPANAKWSNLPLKPEFVPLLLRMVNHVEHRPGLEAPSVVAPEGHAEIGVARDWEPVAGKVTDVAGHSSPLEFRQSDNRWLCAVEGTADKGYYTVDVKGGQAESKSGQAVFAVNLSRDESNFDTISEEQTKELLPEADVMFVDASAQAQQEHGSIGDEREIWRPLIMFMFLVIAVEFLLATLGGQKLDGEPETTVAERIRNLSPGSWVGRMTGASTPVN
jgi:hypothetical protein